MKHRSINKISLKIVCGGGNFLRDKRVRGSEYKSPSYLKMVEIVVAR